MSDDWLDKFDFGNTNFETTCRIGGAVIFVVSATMLSMMLFDWGMYAGEEFKQIIPTFVYYSPIPMVIGSLLMVLKPAWFKPREKTPKNGD